MRSVVFLSFLGAACSTTSVGPDAGADASAASGVVTAAGGSVATADGKARLEVPAGAVDGEVTISIVATSSYPTDAAVVVGSVYRLGPDGQTFKKPVTLRLRYEDGGGRDESRLRIHKVVGAGWSEVPGGAVDPAAKTASASLTSFSVYGVRLAGSFDAGPDLARSDASRDARVDAARDATANDGALIDALTDAKADASPKPDLVKPDAAPADPHFLWHTYSGFETQYEFVNPNAVGVDAAGNAYVVAGCGKSSLGAGGKAPLNPFPGCDDGTPALCIVKFSAAGAYLWHTYFGPVPYAGPFGPTCIAVQTLGLVVDGNGDVYAAGSGDAFKGPAGQPPLHAHSNPWSATNNGQSNLFVVKLDANGAYQWHTFYGHADAFDGGGIAHDGGNLYLATNGSCWPGPQGQAPVLGACATTCDQDPNGCGSVVLKLSKAGAYQWHTHFNYAEVKAAAVASDGSVLVSGTRTQGLTPKLFSIPAAAPLAPPHGDRDLFVIKLAPGGGFAWNTFVGGMCNAVQPAATYGSGLALDASGSVVVAGKSNCGWSGPKGEAPLQAYHGTSFGPDDIVVAKLSPAGAHVWHGFWGSLGEDRAYGLTVGAGGNLYLTGVSGGSWTGPAGQAPRHPHWGQTWTNNLITVALGGAGTYLWHAFYGPSAGMAITRVGANGLAVAGRGNHWFSSPGGKAAVNPHAVFDIEDVMVIRLAE